MFFLKIHKIPDVKLKWLQIRTVHRILATNVVLKEMGIATTDKCTLCSERDSIEHIFWNCMYAEQFWNKFEELLNMKCTTVVNFKFTKSLVLFGTEKCVKTDTVFDLLLLLGKWYLYKCKMDKSVPQISVFKRHLMSRYKIEEYNARLKNTLFNFELKWFQYKPIFMEEN